MPLIKYVDATTQFLARPHELWVHGTQVQATDETRLDVVDPSNGERVSTIAQASAGDVDLAVHSARHAFEDATWRDMKPGERSRLITKIADLIEANVDQLGQLETLETGKPIQFGHYEAIGAANALRYYAGWSDKIHGTTHNVNMPGDHHVYTLKEPVGVVAVVTPWNFPLIIAAMKIGPALAAGCTIVWKPAELTSLTALRVAEIMKEAGLPDGVVNVVTGQGNVTGKALVNHVDIDKVAFTGSTETGRHIAHAAAESLKRCTLELGGKSPNIIFEDADLETAISMSAMGIFFNSGQTCTAPSRLYVHQRIADQVIEGLSKIARGMALGPGLDPSSELGPLVSAQQLERVSGYVARALNSGADIVCGGARHGTRGFFFEPTILSIYDSKIEISQDEVFGPVLVVQAFADETEAIELANDNQYGLGAVFWTKDLSRAHKAARQIKAGTIGVNTVNPADWDVPLAGFGQSGVGLENGAEGLEFYLNTKSVFVAL